MVQPVREAALVVCILLPVLAIASVCLRFYARKARKLPLLMDDWSVLLALVLTVVASMVTFYAIVAKGLGLGPTELQPQDRVPAYKAFYAIMLLIYLDFGVIKISFILFYKRIFTVHYFRIVCDATIAAIACWTIAQFIVEALNSWNIPTFWNEKLANYGAFNISMAVLDLTFDVLTLLLPLPVIYKLQIDNKRKYWLVAMFWLGSICIVSSSLRVYYTYQYLGIGPETPDEWITYVTSSNSLWLAVEANISIIAACLPTLGGFLKGRLASRSHAGSKYTDENHIRVQPSTSSKSATKKFGKSNPIASGDSSRNHWIPLRDLESNTAGSNEQHRGVDTYGEGILVKTTIACEEKPA